MEKNFAKVRVSTPTDLVIVGEALGNAWFRGQGSDQWELESTLERNARIFGVKPDSLLEREQAMLNRFKERGHLYIREFHIPTTEFEWFALIRHYGGPSRLLDVTTSYLVAAYFAVSDSQPKRDAAIWAFCEKVSPRQSTNYDELFGPDSEPSLEIGNPERLNDRMNAQSGTFFIPGSVKNSLKDQVAKKFNTDFSAKPYNYRSVKKVKDETQHRVLKIIIPNDAHSEIFRFLSRCNVRGYSLFPGIDGLAVSLGEIMRVFD